MIDLEPTLGPPHVTDLSVEDVLARSVSGRPWLGFDAQVPDLHDHALILAINVFKDHPRRASARAVEDLLRVLALETFDVATLRDRARRARCLGILVVVLSSLAPGSAQVRAVLSKLGPPPRPLYRYIHRALAGRPDSLLARTWSRLGNDRPSAWPRALGNALQVEWWQWRDPEGTRLEFRDNPSQD
jgi:hypothetical protein